MKIRGIVAEFNPFHSGHKFLIDKIREDGGYVIAIMSGNFVQRGECAVFEKTKRALNAVKNGVDLLLELPLVYSLGAAERFSLGSITILDKLNIIDELWFGSECGDIEILKNAADAISEESSAFKKSLSENLSDGMSFPKARFTALNTIGGSGEVLNSPNNILAAEYLRSLKKLSSSIKPVTITRIGANYNENDIKASAYSATAARNAIKRGKLKSEGVFPMFMNRFDEIIAAKVKTSVFEDFLLLSDCNREIAARLLKASSYNTFDDILNHTSCKRYTYSRIRRILCNLLVNNRFRDLPQPTYIRPLAFSRRGAELLKLIKNSSDIPIISRGAALKSDEIFKLECRGTDIYYLAQGKKGGNEFTFIPQIIN